MPEKYVPGTTGMIKETELGAYISCIVNKCIEQFKKIQCWVESS